MAILTILFSVFDLFSQVQDGVIDDPGDIAFMAYHDSDDGFSFVFLDDCPNSTSIRFTDEEWNGSAFVSTTSEGEVLWTNNTGSTIAAGTVIDITDADDNPSGSIAASLGVAVEDESGFTTANIDELFAITGTRAVPGTFLAFVGDIADNTLSGTGLVNGVTANIITEEGYYSGTTTFNGTAAQCASTINNSGNWTGGGFSFPSVVPDELDGTLFVNTPTWDGSTSTDWNVGSNWSTNAVPTSSDDVVIPSAPSNQPVVSSNPGTPSECANLTVESGATLTIGAGKALTVSGDTDNDGTILIEADATGIGSFIDNGTITGSGSFQMEQYLTGSGGGTPDGVFYYVSSPIPNATASDYSVASGNRLWIDDEVNTEYPELTFGAIPLEVGQGYIARMGATGSITFDGSSFNTGNQSETGLTRTGTTELNRGYNLIGNPYPSTVSWDDASRTNLETTMWYRTNNGGTMTFDTYNAAGMVGTDNNGGGNVSGDIPPTQAVWTRVSADGLTGSVTFENADRSHGTATGIYKVAAEEGTIRLSLSDGTISDEQIILFDPSAADGFDDYDSRKFWASGIPQLYSNINEDTLTINGMNDPLNNPTVPLGMKLPSQGNYSLDATSITFTATPAFLEDTYLNVFQGLNSNPNYSFVSDAGNISDRFILHFNNAAVGIEEAELSSHVFASHGQLNISLSPNTQTANVEVFDMAGRSILTRPLNTSNTILDLNTPTGIYLVRIETPAGMKTHKVALQ